jgi:hypothetical protein
LRRTGKVVCSMAPRAYFHDPDGTVLCDGPGCLDSFRGGIS